MDKGAIKATGLALAMLCAAASAPAQVYKVVNPDGSITYTDQAPEEGAVPMELPEISIVDTDYPNADQVFAEEPEEGAEGGDLTAREMRQMFRDFRILTPAQNESIWGTGNTVVVSWGANAAYEPGMTVSLYVDGQARQAPPEGNVSLTLDRGEHQVYAVLHDQRGRRVATSDTVTFFIKQGSAQINPSAGSGSN